jgi:hypothetical protein
MNSQSCSSAQPPAKIAVTMLRAIPPKATAATRSVVASTAKTKKPVSSTSTCCHLHLLDLVTIA